MSLDANQYVSRYRFDENGNRTDNLTDWGLAQFQQHYKTSSFPRRRESSQDASSTWAAESQQSMHEASLDSRLRGNDGGSDGVDGNDIISDGVITKQAIFYYVYAVLHDPIYREKYALNLKREFPRVPFYADFWQWAAWGDALMQAHIGYEAAVPFALTRTNTKLAKPKSKLKADKTLGEIILDEATTLSGIPAIA